MADEKKSAITFTYVINHYLSIQVRDNKIMFNEQDQKIHLTGFVIQPAMELTKAEAIAHYPNGTEKDIAEAISKVVNVTARATENKTVKTASAAVAPKPAVPAKPDDSAKPVNEALGRLPDIDILVITDQLEIVNQVEVQNGKISINTKPAQMSEFITWRESKKIKVFINSKEIAPKYEMEFIKRVFPQLDLTVTVK